MDMDAKTLAVMMLVFGIIVSLISDYFRCCKREWDKYWEEFDWKAEEDEAEDDKRTKSGKK